MARAGGPCVAAAAEAHRILVDVSNGRPAPAAHELVRIAAQLCGPGSRRLERRLLRLALAQAPSDVALRQKLALSTYKDPELTARDRLDRALAILHEGGDLDVTDDQETLSLAGAIHKRRWELDGQTRHLEEALDHYGYAHEAHVRDAGYDGYPGINAAFILDLLADSLSATEPRSTHARRLTEQRRAEAKRIRGDVVAQLEPRLTRRGPSYRTEDYWQLATLAEALFGQGEGCHAEALQWLERAAAVKPDGWMVESTARQLAHMSRLQGVDLRAEGSSAFAQALSLLLPTGPATLSGIQVGKVGLALSGGGFRASLFHIGVLAHLAELDVLRHVEVLSCVSGGSILGAAYYLRLRQQLEARPDGALRREDYIELVEDLATGFRAGVQHNVRRRLFSSPVAVAKMLAVRGYNRTVRAGELYEKLFYEPVLRRAARRRWLGLVPRRPPLEMRDLLVRPFGEPEDFRPRADNWRRLDKVPILIVNAATLNSGHGWQFTASWMGEPPSPLDDDVDRNPRLRRMYYDQAPPPHDKLRLGTAVAASAAVPGLFPPVTLAGLYPDTTVRLVDGGVHDNQGVAALIDEDCAVCVVSDASGQMHELARPPRLAYRALKRATSALAGRVRRSQWQDLQSRRAGGALRGLMFLHLRSGLGGGARDWIDCQDPQEGEVREPPPSSPTDYGMRRDVQIALARLRTDLDRFSDVEADALMTSGYRMAKHEIARCLPTLPVAGRPAHDWRFLRDFERETADPGAAARTVRILEVGHGMLLRPLRLAVPRARGKMARR